MLLQVTMRRKRSAGGASESVEKFELLAASG